jgi:hypothetical protein
MQMQLDNLDMEINLVLATRVANSDRGHSQDPALPGGE